MRVLKHYLDRLTTEIERAAEQTNATAVHDLRVAVRRATEALRLCGENMPKAKRLRREMREIRRQAAAIRDRDITQQLLRRHGLPTSDPARIYLSGQRDLAAGQLRENLRKLIEKERPHRWQQWAEDASDPSAKLEPIVEAFFTAGQSAARSKDAAELHQFRIAAKRLRYTIEILDPKGGEARLTRLRAVQRQLGTMQDFVAARELLKSQSPLSPLARPMPPILEQGAKEQIERFCRAWNRGFGRRVEKEWLTWAKEQSE